MGWNFPQWFVFCYCLNIIFSSTVPLPKHQSDFLIVAEKYIDRDLIPFCPPHQLQIQFCCDNLSPKNLQRRVKHGVLVPKHCMNDYWLKELPGEKQCIMIWMHRNTYFSTMSNAQPSVYCPLLLRGKNNDDDDKQLLFLQMETNDISHQPTAQLLRLSMSP